MKSLCLKVTEKNKVIAVGWGEAIKIMKETQNY